MGICYVIGPCGKVGVKIPKGGSDLVIAVDKGYLRAKEQGICPDLAIGDFDSLGFVPADLPTLTHPERKDDTDSALAVKYGLERGYSTFVLLGCVGGEREDHTLANISLLAYIAERSGRGYLLGDSHAYTVLKSSRISFGADNAGTVSVFSMGERARGVCERGLSYDLEDAELRYDVALGVSNSFVGRNAEISVDNGALLIYWETDHEKFYETVKNNEVRH